MKMNHRGRILQYGGNGTGLISSQGIQHEFQLEGVWKSDRPPAVNMVVEFVLDELGKVAQIHAVNEADLAKEQAEKALAALADKGKATATAIIDRVGKPTLIASALVIMGWYFLPFIKLGLGQYGLMTLDFHLLTKMVSFDGTGLLETLMNSESLVDDELGFYGVLLLAALAGPFYNQFIKHQGAHLGYCLPFLFMVFICYEAYDLFNTAWSEAIARQAELAKPKTFGEMFTNPISAMNVKEVQGVLESMKETFKLAFGFYIAVPASIFLSYLGIRKYFATRVTY